MVRQALTAAQVDPNDALKITNLETFVLENSWVFVKLTTNAGIVGWGEMLKDKSRTCAAMSLRPTTGQTFASRAR